MILYVIMIIGMFGCLCRFCEYFARLTHCADGYLRTHLLILWTRTSHRHVHRISLFFLFCNFIIFILCILNPLVPVETVSPVNICSQYFYCQFSHSCFFLIPSSTHFHTLFLCSAFTVYESESANLRWNSKIFSCSFASSPMNIWFGQISWRIIYSLWELREYYFFLPIFIWFMTLQWKTRDVPRRHFAVICPISPYWSIWVRSRRIGTWSATYLPCIFCMANKNKSISAPQVVLSHTRRKWCRNNASHFRLAGSYSLSCRSSFWSFPAIFGTSVETCLGWSFSVFSHF